MGVKNGVFAIIYSSSEAWYKIECWGKLLYILSSDILKIVCNRIQRSSFKAITQVRTNDGEARSLTVS